MLSPCAALIPSKKSRENREGSHSCGVATTTDLWSSRTLERHMSQVSGDFVINPCKCSFFHKTAPKSYPWTEGSNGFLEIAGRDTCMHYTDNETNVVTAVSPDNWTWLPCFGNRLHLAIGE